MGWVRNVVLGSSPCGLHPKPDCVLKGNPEGRQGTSVLPCNSVLISDLGWARWRGCCSSALSSPGASPPAGRSLQTCSPSRTCTKFLLTNSNSNWLTGYYIEDCQFREKWIIIYTQKRYWTVVFHDKFTACKGFQSIYIIHWVREVGLNSRPLDYEKSILTFRPERCAISRKSTPGICRYKANFLW